MTQVKLSKYTDQWYRHKGFKVENTGGNCTAFRKEFPEFGLFILVTAAEDSRRPSELAEPCTAALYCYESGEKLAEIAREAPDSHALFEQFKWGRWLSGDVR